MKSVRNLLLFIFSLLFIVSFISCDKDEDKIEKDRKSLITGTWSLYASGTDSDKDGRISDDEKEYAPNDRILELTLNPNGKGTIYENYSAEEETTTNFDWEWFGEEAIVLSSPNEEEPVRFNIYMLTETELAAYGGIDDSDNVLFFEKKQ